jgi:hypothetical protein
MKTKNQTEHVLLELALATAANEDGISPGISRDAATPLRKQAWSPYEVWRTRVKTTVLRYPADGAPIGP